MPPNSGPKSPAANVTTQGNTFPNGPLMENLSFEKLLNKKKLQSDFTLDSSSIKSSSVEKLATKNSLQSDTTLDTSIKSSSVDKLATKNSLQSDSTPVNKSPKQTSPNRPAKKFHTRVYNFQNGLHNNAIKKSAEKISNPELLTKNSLQSDSILDKSSIKGSSVDKLSSKNSLQSDSILDKSSIKGSSAEKLAGKHSLKSDSTMHNTSNKTFKNCSSKGNSFI